MTCLTTRWTRYAISGLLLVILAVSIGTAGTIVATKQSAEQRAGVRATAQADWCYRSLDKATCLQIDMDAGTLFSH